MAAVRANIGEAGSIFSSPWSPDSSIKAIQDMTDDKPQSEKFKEAARELECDEDEARWDERLKRVAKQKPSGDHNG